jgi:hypothetical protein
MGCHVCTDEREREGMRKNENKERDKESQWRIEWKSMN